MKTVYVVVHRDTSVIEDVEVFTTRESAETAIKNGSRDVELFERALQD